MVTAVVGLAMALCSPATAGAQIPTSDSVTGTAVECIGPDPVTDPFCPVGTFTMQFEANAHSGPDGGAPGGTMSWNDFAPGGVFSEVNVSCLSVTGHTAIVGVTGTRTFVRVGIRVSVAGLVRVTDGGGPGSGLDRWEFDIAQGPIFPQPPAPLPGPTDCSAFPAGREAFVNDLGDVVVTDSRPLPTSTEQCKNGGWRNYGVFNNPGDCVSFVATGGKNPPARQP